MDQLNRGEVDATHEQSESDRGHKCDSGIRQDVLTLGILALQGDFRSHELALQKLNRSGVNVKQVRLASEVRQCDALLLPGGESTAMAIIGRTHNVIDSETNVMQELRRFVLVDRKPVWGTCAGCILLAEIITDDACDEEVITSTPPEVDQGRANRIGGLPITVARNYFGRQRNSFEAPLICYGDFKSRAGDFTAVCIRAPAILRTHNKQVEVLAEVEVPERKASSSPDKVIAAVAYNNLFATIFHPELTSNPGVHSYFLEKFVLGSKQSSS